MYYHKAVEFYEMLAKQLVHQGHVLDVFASSVDQVILWKYLSLLVLSFLFCSYLFYLICASLGRHC